MARGRPTNVAGLRKSQQAAKESRQRLVNQFRDQTRDKFFNNRQDISDDRLDRRRQQDLAEQRFIRTRMKPVIGSSDLLQKRDPEGIDLAEFRRRNAMKYGPTLGEIGGDIRYGLGNLARGFGDFISKGGAIGSVISDIYNRFKGGTQQGIETVKGLYDNLRTTLSGQPTVTYGGGSTMVTTSGGQPRVDLTPTSIATETLPAMNLSRNVGDESDPSIFGITNTGVPLPFLRSTVDNPNLINVLPQGGGYLPEGFSNTLPPYPRFFDYFSSNAGVAPIVPLYKSGGSVDKYAGLGYKLK